MTMQYEQENINLGGAGGGANTFVVGPPGSGASFNSIQDAIDTAGEREIDNIASVLVLGGTYQENISLLRGVSVLGLGGAILEGSATFDLNTSPVDPQDTVSVIQNFIIEPPVGTPGIVITGANFQQVALNNLLVNVQGATAFEMSNTGTNGPNISSAIVNSCQFDSDSLRLDHSAGGLLLGNCALQGDPSMPGANIAGAFHAAQYCVFEGIVTIAAGSFADHSFCKYNTSLGPAIDVDGFLNVAQSALQAGSSPAIISSGATGSCGFVDLAWGSPAGIGFGPGVSTFSAGQAYVPSPPAAAAYATPPTSLEDAVDRIAIALATAVAPGGGIPPI